MIMMSVIGEQVRILEKERREKQKSLMEEWDKTYYYPKMKELRAQCEHNWRFCDTNPLGYPIYSCTICGKTDIKRG